MIISSSHLFAKQITAGGTPPIPNNVVYDCAFNSSRMKQGFDLVNNVAFIQDMYAGISFGQGQTAIANGAMYSVIQADDGTTLGNHGTDNDTLYFENNYITHVGRAIQDSVDGVDYYLPVNMQSVIYEGYSTLHIKLGYSKQGMPSGMAGAGYLLMYLYGVSSNYSMLTIGGDLFRMPVVDDETEVTYYSLLNANTSEIPKYLRLTMSDGTYHIKKIWFE